MTTSTVSDALVEEVNSFLHPKLNEKRPTLTGVWGASSMFVAGNYCL